MKKDKYKTPEGLRFGYATNPQAAVNLADTMEKKASPKSKGKHKMKSKKK